MNSATELSPGCSAKCPDEMPRGSKWFGGLSVLFIVLWAVLNILVRRWRGGHDITAWDLAGPPAITHSLTCSKDARRGLQPDRGVTSAYLHIGH